MRATIGQVVKNPRAFWTWWYELPMRHRAWWSEALFATGEGWLRWEHDYRERIDSYTPDYESWPVFPPLRRAWMVLHQIWMIPFLLIREHLSWEEARSDFSWLRADPERRKELWR